MESIKAKVCFRKWLGAVRRAACGVLYCQGASYESFDHS